MRRFALPMLVALLAARTAAAQAATPIETLRGPLDAAIAILQDPRYRNGSEKESQKEKLWEQIRKVFDFEGITVLAVGQNWKRFSPEQKKVFTDVFTTRLGNSYLSKIQGSFNNDKVEFLSEEMLSPAKARVKTRIVREVDSIPVDYSVRPIAGAWKIYDVVIEGVSLVANYRTQFNDILSRDAPDVLIERVRTQNKAQEQEKK